MRRIAAITETYDVALAPHCPLGPIAFAASMQVAISSPNCELTISSSLREASDIRWSCHTGNELAGRLIRLTFPYHHVSLASLMKMHYNQGADLFTYIQDVSVFDIKEGYIKKLEGKSRLVPSLTFIAHRYQVMVSASK